MGPIAVSHELPVGIRQRTDATTDCGQRREMRRIAFSDRRRIGGAARSCRLDDGQDGGPARSRADWT